MLQSANLEKRTEGGFLLHRQVDNLSHLPVGTFLRLPDGELLAVGNPGPNEYCEDTRDGYALFRSDDDGASWERIAWNLPDRVVRPAPTGAFLCTRQGTVICAFADTAERHWTWDDERKDGPGSILPTVVMRSTNGGKSWSDMQKLHPEWTGATRDILETKEGRVVFTTMKMRHHPGRHTVLTYSSPDDGVTWQPSNVIDLGGHGHHDGATEATIVETTDGRLVKYIRTMWGCFWRAESSDGGRYWHPYGPTTVAASSAPGMLTRLASGRILLVWNRPYPHGSTQPLDMRGGDRIWSAVPASNYRKQLSISFSDDECQTWSEAVAIAQGDREITYPQAFEHAPGEIWITAHRWNFRVRLRESDFIV